MSRDDTLFDALLAEPDGRRHMAAAQARFDALEALLVAFENSGLTQKELADRLGIGKSAVGHVLSGNGNVRITTLAEYLYESGEHLVITSMPLPGAPRPDAGEHALVSTPVKVTFATQMGERTERIGIMHNEAEQIMSVDVAPMLEASTYFQTVTSVAEAELAEALNSEANHD